MHLAAMGGHDQMITVLAEAGASPDLPATAVLAVRTGDDSCSSGLPVGGEGEELWVIVHRIQHMLDIIYMLPNKNCDGFEKL